MAIAAAFLTIRFRMMLLIIGSGILLVDSIMPPAGKNTLDCLLKITGLCILPHPRCPAISPMTSKLMIPSRI